METYQLKLEVEVDESSNVLEGYRIVDIDYILKRAMNVQVNHNKICTGGLLLFHNEKRKGLFSTFTYKCNACDKEESICTEKPQQEKTINKRIWKQCLQDNFNETIQQERAIAIEKNDIDTDGIPFTTVYLDGGWSKRSYGHSYSAASGTAVIIGKHTGKVLFLGVRNKYCSICARGENKGKESRKHICYKNWKGSSTAMEADIVVEGFNDSIITHDLKYKYFIADGDSTVFSKIKQNVSYGLH
ncbi:hypothetical protein NQ315_014696, partial [Exocentrus adspersus]